MGTSYSMAGIPTVSLGSKPLHYYVRTQQWLSELEFNKNELRFLLDLLSDYSFRASDEPSRLRRLSKLDHQLVNLNETIIIASTKLRDAVFSLERTAAFAPNETEEKSAETFLALETGINQITRTFRKLKSELFILVSTIIDGTRSFAG